MKRKRLKNDDACDPNYKGCWAEYEEEEGEENN